MKKFFIIISLIFTGAYSQAEVEIQKSLLVVSSINPSKAFHINLKFSRSVETDPQYDVEGEVIVTETILNSSCPSIPAGIYKTTSQKVTLENGTGISNLHLSSVSGPVSFSMIIPRAFVTFDNVSGLLQVEHVQGYHCSNPLFQIL
ncbi:MAG: hypothetical protein K0R29_1683 [Pseudobdellovibrio sp.]|jgi:hypothetical protein|nr:hypothetical protein [Pseudobdellovibrio sp.]